MNAIVGNIVNEDDLPALEDPDLIVRREKAKEKSRMAKVNFMSGQVIDEIVSKVTARSAVERILSMVLERSAWRIRILEVWKILEGDRGLQKVIMKKIQRQEQLRLEEEKENRIVKQSMAKRNWEIKYQSRQVEEEMVGLASMLSCMSIVELEPWKDVCASMVEVEEIECVLN